MKHASAATLQKLALLLSRIRQIAPELKEKSPGCFYNGSKAYLHFHEDPAGLFADLRLEEWARFKVDTLAERKKLLSLIQSQWERS